MFSFFYRLQVNLFWKWHSREDLSRRLFDLIDSFLSIKKIIDRKMWEEDSAKCQVQIYLFVILSTACDLPAQ